MIESTSYMMLPLNKKIVVKDDSTGKDTRIMKEDAETVFVYLPGKKRYGHRISQKAFCSMYSIKVVKKTDKNTAWHRRINRAIKCLESSGLWPNILEVLQNLNKMTYKDKEEMLMIYTTYRPQYIHSDDSEEVKQQKKASNQAQVEALFGDYITKYPFIFEKNGVVNASNYLWEMSEVKLKKMNFGKYWGDSYRSEIKNALEAKTSYSTGKIQVNYDNSFSYDAEKNKAWYSEEYRGAGNGHYYLALDGETALFVEDD